METHPATNLQGMAPLLQVFDMPASLKFYRDGLGFEVAQSSAADDNADWVLLRHGVIELMLNTAYEAPQRPAAPNVARQAAHADTALYFGCSDTDGLYRLLAGNGLNLSLPAVTGYGWKMLTLTDPDGYQLCFHWPADGISQ